MQYDMKRGFTLIEIMTAMAIFSVVVVISMGSILAVFDLNRKSESVKSAMDNLNLAIESMAREMRFGSMYSCSPTLPTTLPPPLQDCADIDGEESIAFRNTDRTRTIVYRKFGSGIQKSLDAGATFAPVTSPEITINDLKFYVLGTSTYGSGDREQPRIIIKIRGIAGTKSNSQTDFTMQTMVSQRQLDNQ